MTGIELTLLVLVAALVIVVAPILLLVAIVFIKSEEVLDLYFNRLLDLTGRVLLDDLRRPVPCPTCEWKSGVGSDENVERRDVS